MSPAAAVSPGLVSTEAVYAAFTLNLLRFVTWPEKVFAAANAPLVIGTFAQDPINAQLDAAARGEAVNGHPVHTIRIESPDDLQRCHAVFLSHSVRREGAVLQGVAGKPILTISDSDRFLERGGHVRFVPQPPRTALRISVENLKGSHLECRAQLLRIAATP